MNDTNPTANAATTVVSTPDCAAAPSTAPPGISAARPRWPLHRAYARACSPAVEGGQLRVEPARVVGIQLWPCVRCRGARRAAPATRGDGDPGQAEGDEQAGDDVHGEVEAVVVGHGERGGAVGLRELALDLRLVLPLGDPAADERPLTVGHRRLGDVQRRPALDAHDLVLYVGERGPRRGGGGRGREQQGQRDGERQASHSSGSTCWSSHAWSTGPRRRAVTRPSRSTTNVSGYPFVP